MYGYAYLHNAMVGIPNHVSFFRYVWLLLVTKFFRCIGVFVAFDAVRSIHVVYFLLLVTLM